MFYVARKFPPHPFPKMFTHLRLSPHSYEISPIMLRRKTTLNICCCLSLKLCRLLNYLSGLMHARLKRRKRKDFFIAGWKGAENNSLGGYGWKKRIIGRYLFNYSFLSPLKKDQWKKREMKILLAPLLSCCRSPVLKSFLRHRIKFSKLLSIPFRDISAWIPLSSLFLLKSCYANWI